MNESAGRGRWGRLFAESALIVASILLAFAIDAVWDESKERAREREYIEALRVEMALAKDELDEDFGRRGRWVELTDSILAEIEMRTAPDSAVSAWIVEIGMGMSRFFPPSSVLDDLVSSGSLALLSSKDLRFALLTYQRGRERVNFIGDWGRGLVDDGLRVYLSQRFRLPLTTPGPIQESGRLPIEQRERVSVRPDVVRSVLNDPVFRNEVIVRRWTLQLVQRRTVQLSELIDEVLAHLDAEAERLGV